jgi:hypothetical protein
VKFGIGIFFKSEYDILSAKIAVSVDLLKRISWIQLYQNP